MINEKQKGTFRRIFGLFRHIRIPWPLYILQVIIGLISTRVSLLLVPYSADMQTGNLGNVSFLWGYLIFSVLAALISLLQQVRGFYATAIVTRRIQDHLIEHSLRLNMSSLERNASQLVSWITQDCSVAEGLLATLLAFFTSISSTYMSVTSIPMVDAMLVPLIAAFLYMIFTTWLQGRLYYLRERRGRRANAEMTAYLAEHLSFFAQVKQLHSKSQESRRGRNAAHQYFLAEIYQAVMQILMDLAQNSLTTGVTILVFVVGVPMVRNSEISLTDLAAFQGYIMMAHYSLYGTFKTYILMMYYKGYLYYIAGLSSEPEEVYERSESMDMEDQDLTFDKVSFGYGDQPVLQNVSFTIPKGKMTLLVGPNGSGKTTVFKLIERFYTPTAGAIHFGPTMAEDIHLQEWRQSFAYVLQEPQLFNGTIRDNIVYGMNRVASDDEVAAAAQLACAEKFIQELPGGYDFVIGQNGCRLSAGQRQRIAIARAVMLDPAYLLLDEATCNLDIYSEQAVTAALLHLMEGRTTVMISHNMDMLRRADHVVVLNGGVVEASGTREDVQRQSPTLQALVQADAE